MSDFKAKMHQNRFRLGLCRRHRWGELTALPRSFSWNKGDLLLKEVEGKRYREGKGRIGREEERRENEGSGKGINPLCIFKFSMHTLLFSLLMHFIYYCTFCICV